MFMSSRRLGLIVILCAFASACGGGGGSDPPPQNQPQTIVFATPGALSGTAGTTLTNLASGGAGTGVITYQSSSVSVATVDASTGLVALLTAGTTTITATKAASTGFNAATASYVLNVTGAPQSIRFATATPMTGEAGTNITNIASGGAGTGAITYESSNTSVVTVNAQTGVVSLVGVGTASITATKAASASHAAATASYAITVSQGSQSIQFATGGPVSLGVASSVTNVATGGSGTGTITYATSDAAVATVNATTGVVTSVSPGSVVISATKAADANYRAAQASYTLNVMAANSNTFSAWIGATGAQVSMPAPTIGKQLASARIADCTPGDTVPQCAGAQLTPIAGVMINDTRATLTNPAYYSVVDGATAGPAVEVSPTRFSGRIGHAAVYFNNRYWVIGGGVPVLPSPEPVPYIAKADVWSSPDGRTWKLETSDGGFNARWFHQVVVFNNRLWILSGAPAPIIDPLAPWYDDVWSSADGVSWQKESDHAFPWRSTDLNVIVFNDEMLAVSGGRVYSSTTGFFTPKVAGDPVLLTGTTLGRTNATLTLYNNELWYIGGKLDYPINVPANGDAMNDVWKSSDGTTWTRVIEHAPFSPRYRHVSFVANGRLWVLGGQNATAGVPGAQSKDAWSTTDGVSWTQENVDGIARGYLMPLVQVGNKATVIGGIQYAYSNSSWQTTNGSNWVELSAQAQFSMRHTRGVTFNGNLWILGGNAVDGRLADTNTNEVWRSADGVNWTRVAPNGPVFSPRDGNGFVVFKDRLWVIGGWSNPSGGTGTHVTLNDVWSSADGVTWRLETAGAQFTPRVGQGTVAFDNKLWVIGGFDGSTHLKDVWSSNDGVTWTLVNAMPDFSARVAHRVIEFNNAIWLIGGNTNSSTPLNDIWRSTDGVTWTQLPAAGFAPRTRHAVAVLNNRLYVVGGTTHEVFASATRMNDVWSTDGTTWRQETANAAFSPRSLHTLMAHQGQLWVIAGLGETVLNDVWRSADGINWRVGFSRDIDSP